MANNHLVRTPDITKFSSHPSVNILDSWIISRLHKTIKTVTQSLEKFDAQSGSLTIESFLQDLSLWYIRRSRERVGPSAENETDKKAFYETTYAVLITLAKLLAPFIPFISDEIYTNLTNETSVHLANWPNSNDQLMNPQLDRDMSNGQHV